MTGPLPQLIGVPVLQTERLTLRAPHPADWPRFRAYRMDPQRTRYAGGPKTEVQAAEHFASFFGHWAMRGVGRLIAQLRDTGEAIGHFGPMQWADEAPLELTWSLWSTKAEGRGLAGEGARALLDWLFGPAGRTEARAEVHSDNAASHAIARRLGGQIVAGEVSGWIDGAQVYRFARKAGQGQVPA